MELREALAAAPDEARTALRILLGDRRMQVAADPEHGWRLEGVFEVTAGARAGGPGPRGHVQVAGGRYVTVEQARILTRRLRGSVTLAA